ncbi:DNA repair protein RecO [Azomonas macrocytogenes]|uniref:DNA repair protein RecO n=1 Tax=Azomonas macrocytogenes TaxID=69962 RepID=A0A839T6P7_AZOMA|nr:DNA repair protein RecO [Azomonas macrocytogenes]MBB3104749.1 DNA repair protein RecO (recombination protein O) [Azomonas macrocytogenes]
MPILAFVLHSRPYKESSALLELFTPQGRVAAVLRAARGRSGSVARPFSPLELELRGKSELKTVVRLEPAGIPLWLSGQSLYSGLYLNELLMRLLPAEDPHPAFFEHYSTTLTALALGCPLEPLLRAFEWRLLGELGYGFALDTDVAGQPLGETNLYRFLPDAGFERAEQFQPGMFSGHELLAMAQADWKVPGVLNAAKRLMRQALAPHLGARPLVSRELFMNPKESSRD